MEGSSRQFAPHLTGQVSGSDFISYNISLHKLEAENIMALKRSRIDKHTNCFVQDQTSPNSTVVKRYSITYSIGKDGGKTTRELERLGVFVSKLNQQQLLERAYIIISYGGFLTARGL